MNVPSHANSLLTALCCLFSTNWRPSKDFQGMLGSYKGVTSESCAWFGQWKWHSNTNKEKLTHLFQFLNSKLMSSQGAVKTMAISLQAEVLNIHDLSFTNAAAWFELLDFYMLPFIFIFGPRSLYIDIYWWTFWLLFQLWMSIWFMYIHPRIVWLYYIITVQSLLLEKSLFSYLLQQPIQLQRISYLSWTFTMSRVWASLSKLADWYWWQRKRETCIIGDFGLIFALL